MPAPDPNGPEHVSSLISLRPAAPGGAAGGSTPTGPAGLPANTDDAATFISSVARSLPMSDPSLGLSIGSRLGNFEILEPVGVGGMAAVLKARDLELGRVVALKILPPHMARDPDSVTRFRQEGRAAARLDHDNVARAFACGEDRGLHFIAFEFVEGDNLRVLIERRGAIPPGECVRIMLQVAAGLAHASLRGVVHRDIKPSNLVIAPDGRAKIVDMGLARNLAQTVNGGVTQSGVTLGTFDYISPEQALDPRRADVRSDIYSLGCAFYHAATGRPPVPEGTAARKLHFHQYEPIPDPRLFNPAIPDEFAFVLARMMAKDPARRYQTAGELIVTLRELARLLHVPVEPLAIDPASLPPGDGRVTLRPQPPRVSPAVLIGAAVVAAAAVLALTLSGSRLPNLTPRPPEGEGSARQLLDPAPGPGVPANPAPAPTVVVAANLDQLVAALRNPATTEIRLEPGQRYDFTRVAGGVVAAGKVLLLEPRPGGLDAKAGPPILRVGAVPLDPADPTAPRPTALTFARPERLTLRGLTVETADGPLTGDNPERPGGLVVIDAGKLEVAECRFEAADGDLSATDVVGLTVLTNPAAGPTTLLARSSYFGLRRGVAVVLAGHVQAEFSECMFPPHPACFALRPTGIAGELSLRSCSFLLEKGSVAEVEAGARWQVRAGYCVFGAPPPDPDAPPAVMMNDMPERRPAVVRLLAEQPEGVSYSGRAGERNAYFRVDPLALANRGYSFEECRRVWSPAPAIDTSAAELRVSPWATDPVPLLGGPRPWEALRVRTTQPLLRVPRGDVVVLGAKALPGASVKIYNPWPPAAQETAADPRVRVVYPGAEGELPRNVYLTLEAAVADAKPDDVIQIRHDGPLELPQTNIDKPRLRLTVRPYPGSNPVLTASRDNNKVDGCLFRLVEGQLTLEGLDVRLKARAGRAGEARTLAVVSVVAGRELALKDCTVTLEERDGDGERLAAVTLTDPGGEMRTGATPAPSVTFERTLIRGRGRAVHVAASRPFDLTVRDCVTALAGPTLDIEPAAKVAPAAGAVHVRLEQLTAVLAGPLLSLTPVRRDARPDARPDARAGGWVPVEVTAARCLFAPLDDGPLVRIDGADPAEFTKVLRWEAPRPNWYANVPAAAAWMEVTPEDDARAATPFAAADWFRFTAEDAEGSTGAVRFAEAPASARKLGAVQAAHLAVERVDIPNATPTGAGSQLPTAKR